MLKKILTRFLLVPLCLACTEMNPETTVEPQHLNALTQQEKDDGWKLLFDGVSTENWRGYNTETFPGEGWMVNDGALTFTPLERSSGEGGRNIITKNKFENFHLKLEWKIGERSNSGIFYGVLEQEDIAIHWSAIEYQIIDPDIFSESTPETEKKQSGALYGLVPAEHHNARPIGEWNSAEIIIDGSQIIHRQNEEDVVEVERWNRDWFEMIRNSKFESHNEFGSVRKGHIGIQDHGGSVMVRNIKIKVLD